jgi:hypothetical protein
MSKCLSIVVGLTPILLVGVAVAQTGPIAQSAMQQVRTKVVSGPQCTKFDGTVYGPNAVTVYDGATYRCAYVYDEWMTRTSRVAWVRVVP